MTIRIIAQLQDFNAGAHVPGGHACTEMQSFDIECPKLERFLASGNRQLCHTQIIGGYVLKESTP